MTSSHHIARTAFSVVVIPAAFLLLSLPTSERARAQAYHYESVPGRTVGIWVDSWASGQLAVFRHHYGFNAALVTPYNTDYDSARAAGFPPSSLMMDVIADHYRSVVEQYDAGWYYIDEPVEHDCAGHSTSGGPLFTPTELSSRRDFIRLTRPGAQFVISGYKRCSHLRGAGPSVDIVMYASYAHWRKLAFSLCNVNMGWGDKREAGWYPSGGDQRQSWTDMRSMFGAKFAMTWVHGGGDEYDDLLGHANSLGLNGIWLYHEGPIYADKMEQFLAAAVKHGWLRLVEGPAQRVEFASLDLLLENRQDVTLSWTTPWEIDIRSFQLEKRSDAGGEYEVVSGKEVSGNGTTMTPHTYALTEASVPSGGWWYRVVGVSSDGNRFPSEPSFVRISDKIGIQVADSPYPVLKNYPNPFNPSTRITYSIPSMQEERRTASGPEAGWATLTVYDLLGRKVAVLVDEKKEPGTYSVTFDGAGLASGVYVYRLSVGGTVTTRSMLLTK